MGNSCESTAMEIGKQFNGIFCYPFDIKDKVSYKLHNLKDLCNNVTEECCKKQIGIGNSIVYNQDF